MNDAKRLTLAWVRQALRTTTRRRIIAAYLLNPEDESGHVVIGCVIAPVRGRSSLQVSESYHRRFTSERQWAKWCEKPVDWQFYYQGEVPDEGSPLL